MNKDHEKAMIDFDRLLKSRDFKSLEEVQQFMNQFVGKQIPSFPKEALSNQELAQDLVLEAGKLSDNKALKKIEEALKLDKNCIEAYEFLAQQEFRISNAAAQYLKAINIGRELFGGENLEKHKGAFWGMHETRPFMRCMHQYAICLYLMGQKKECISIMEEMIELNPNDNQGVRDQLMLYLIELNEFEKFEKYAEQYNDDCMAYSYFNKALFAFKTTGDSEGANKLLKDAIHKNKFVAPKILTKNPIKKLPEYYGFGDKNEADYYVHDALLIWIQTKGALEWLKKISI